ncbi:MAG: DUF2889 domain-containing protein [Candidatus Aminicenantia bacterium]
MEVYERNINAAVSRLDDDHILTRASLLDLSHNMNIEIKVKISNKEIVDVEGNMTKVPFEICHKTLTLLPGIIGLRIERGITKKLAEKLGRSSGCTHLFELAVAAVRLSANVMFGFAAGTNEWRERRRLPDKEFIQKVKPILKNSCLPFKE